MVITRRFLWASALLLSVGFGGALVTGCGGGGGTADLSPRSIYVTRASAGNYLADTLILAAREAPDGFIPTATANSIQDDLIRIRTRYPAVVEMQKRASTVPLHSLYIETSPAGQITVAWAQGKVLTGIAAVDAVLTRYKVDSVARVQTQTSGFLLQFKDPINPTKVNNDLTLGANEEMQSISSPLRPAITFEQALLIDINRTAIARKITDTGRVYAFVRGWGDCAAGCTSAHTRTVIIGNDGTLSMQEANPPPDGRYD